MQQLVPPVVTVKLHFTLNNGLNVLQLMVLKKGTVYWHNQVRFRVYIALLHSAIIPGTLKKTAF